MQCFTPSECSEWLRQRGITELPYATNRQTMTLQFEPPRSPRKLVAFTRQLFDAFGEFPGALLQFTDWNTHHPDEMAMIGSLRRSHGEQRRLIDAPGHLFASAEAAEAISHCYVAAMFDWSAYLYLASGAGTVYFWEGDLIDLFGFDKSHKVYDVIENYDVRITHAET
jgi:hypothetical protein